MAPATPPDMAVPRSLDAARSELARLAPALEVIVVRALRSRELAPDVVQEVLVRVLRAVDEGRRIEGTLAAFAYGIAMHVVADVYRDRDRAIFVDIDAMEVPAPVSQPLDRLVDAEERAAMRDALQRLDPAERDLLRRCYVQGQKVADIARDLREPAARIRKRKSRIVERLRGIIRGDHTGASQSRDGDD